MLATTVKRRILSMAAVPATMAMMACAGLTMASPAQASPAAPGHVSVTIDSMTPQFAGPGDTVTVKGVLHNGTGQTQAGLQLQLLTSAAAFTSRDGMDSFLAQGVDSDLAEAGSPFVISASVKPGATVGWTASFDVATEGIDAFGVYPVVAQLEDISDDLLTSAQTLLPYWPGSQRTAGLAHPLNISWMLPLIDQPHHQVCAALTNNDLAASLSPGGRLSALLTAGVSHADVDPTWVVDPALLSDAATMTSAYTVNSRPTCVFATPEPASKAAGNWLATFKTDSADQPVILTPYANVDMSALVHQGMNAGIASAYTMGDAVANSVLGRDLTPQIAWPAGGNADLSVLTSLATYEHVGTVVLNSSEMPTPASDGFEPDDAVTSIRTGTGTTMNVLLSDNTLTSVLAAGDTSSGTQSQAAKFSVRQRFLAETAMIAAEAPGSARSVVVAPPQNWSPSLSLADGLLSETASAPWLKPTALSNLTTATDTQRKVTRQPPPSSKDSPGELSQSYLSRVGEVGGEVDGYQAILYKPGTSYTQSLDQALTATESSAWRGAGAAQGLALTGNLSDYLTNAESKIKIITSVTVPMGGASGAIPVPVQNDLLPHAIKVKLNVSVEFTPGRPSQLTVGKFQDVLILQPGEEVTIRLPLSSAPQGPTLIFLSLTSPDGKTLPISTSLTVQSTRYGRDILFLIGAAIGVLVLSSIYRGLRRRMRDDAHLVSEEADPPGSVDTGNTATGNTVTGSTAQHPTEAPDDLADARPWADDA